MKLNTEEVYTLVHKNSYFVNEAMRNISRDSCGEYSNTTNLPALSLPGGDIGLLLSLISAANTYAFELDLPEALITLCNLIGGTNNFSFHNTYSNIVSLSDISCTYIKYILSNLQDFDISEKDKQVFSKLFAEVSTKHLEQFEQKSDVHEGGILLVKGEYGILPRFSFMSDNGMVSGSVYVFQKTLAEQRNRVFAQELIKDGAVILFEGLSEEYLSDAISDTMENHFFQTIPHIFPDIPLFTITFAEDSTYTVEKE